MAPMKERLLALSLATLPAVAVLAEAASRRWP